MIREFPWVPMGIPWEWEAYREWEWWSRNGNNSLEEIPLVALWHYIFNGLP